MATRWNDCIPRRPSDEVEGSGNPLAALAARAAGQLMTRMEFSRALADVIDEGALGLAGLQFVLCFPCEVLQHFNGHVHRGAGLPEAGQ